MTFGTEIILWSLGLTNVPDEFEDDKDNGDVEPNDTVAGDQLVLRADYPLGKDVKLGPVGAERR